MNINEINILRNGSLSYHARLLYALSLEPFTDNNSIVIPDYPQIIKDLSYNQLTPEGYVVNLIKLDFNDINNLFLELIHYGLVREYQTPTYPGCYDKVQVLLPLKASFNQGEISQRRFMITPDWAPGANYPQIAQMSGLQNPSYDRSDLQQFITYWMGQNQANTDYNWTIKFIKWLKILRRQQQANS
ncbi:MAG: DnaT-like ssDNA-binding domain-containing protein [Succinivibrionaceae bacterium]|nr:DnaT-like ssDNA-binding domain-containing protein [Ruminobacter sp.]MDY5779001.1 DnaT-like ssDNA-binding domain-containing protein [Succinivibrionaceae bacterium]MEE1339215.1 DnaT-like ssDNA-binding domain-containing protein [Succinivibrionaceae bacterium]